LLGEFVTARLLCAWRDQASSVDEGTAAAKHYNISSQQQQQHWQQQRHWQQQHYRVSLSTTNNSLASTHTQIAAAGTSGLA
jgi:hypothetical protein